VSESRVEQVQPRVLRTVLLANRGEIARRVFRTARAMGMRTVAVFSDADADAPYVAEADLAVRLPGERPGDTYLRADLIVDAALRTGADCVHPGYGFLSEQAGFVRAVEAAGLVFVGPSAAAVEAMGSKLGAKELLAEAGVPMLPSVDASALDGEPLAGAGEQVGYPLLVKASAGGGGRGMRTVREPGGLAESVAAARREASSAFGDPTVFLERLLEGARHVEVQVLGDAHGTVVALHERECSIQRRHQKVIEEAPSPAVDAALRARLCDAAVRAARAIRYVGAGTVEFLLDASGEFFFLEVNTRLQVEHPVTEAVTGLDLVRLQFDVAAGLPLPAEAREPRLSGHAIEARLYAEDPARGWLPQAGRLDRFDVPADVEFMSPSKPGVRLDSGVGSGSVVGVHYDPMLAKIIAWAPERTQACLLLADALARARLHGLTTNRDLLVGVLRSPAFLAGETDTGFLDANPVAELVPAPDPAVLRLHAVAAVAAQAAVRRGEARVLGGMPAGWRNNPSDEHAVAYRVGTRSGGAQLAVQYAYDRGGRIARASVDGEPMQLIWLTATVLAPGNGFVGVRVDVEADLGAGPVRQVLDVVVGAPVDRGDPDETEVPVDVDGPLGHIRLVALPRYPPPVSTAALGSLAAPMPGVVARVDVKQGATVAAGQPLLVLEAMKMEHPLLAPVAGTLTSLPVVAGQQVVAGAVLAVIDPAEPEG